MSIPLKKPVYNEIESDVRQLISSKEQATTKSTMSGVMLVYINQKIKDKTVFFIIPATNIWSKLSAVKNKVKTVYDGKIKEGEEERYVLEQRIVKVLKDNDIERLSLEAVILTECQETELGASYDYWDDRLKANYTSLTVPYAVSLIRTLESKYLYTKDCEEVRGRLTMLLSSLYDVASNYMTHVIANHSLFGTGYSEKNLDLFSEYVAKRIKLLEDDNFVKTLDLENQKRKFWMKYAKFINGEGLFDFLNN